MKIPLYQIDAFTSQVFSGNPAAVCPLDKWLDDETLRLIAAENNLSETAFLVKKTDHYQLRWFTPEVEVDLCGHATLASAFVILNHLDPSSNSVSFETKSGKLAVIQDNELLWMDFPSRPALKIEPPKDLIRGLEIQPEAVFYSRDYLAVYQSEDVVKSLQPDMHLLKKLEGLGVIATAPSKEADFVSRFFAPKVGVPEDPVTGSAHCTLVPYWSERLEKNELHAFQVSKRGGELFCENAGNRVKIGGKAVRYLEGAIYI